MKMHRLDDIDMKDMWFQQENVICHSEQETKKKNFK